MSRSCLLLCCSFAAGCFFDDEPKISSVSVEDVPDTADDPAELRCDERSYDVGFTEATNLGFSASDVVAFLSGPRSAELTYADGSTTTLTVAIDTDGGAVRYTERTDSADAGLSCTDSLSLGLNLSFSTSDGQFSELLHEELSLSEYASGVNLYPEEQVDELVGSFSLERTDSISYVIFVGSDAFQGEIVAVDEANGEEDSTDECGVAAWGAALSTGCW